MRRALSRIGALVSLIWMVAWLLGRFSYSGWGPAGSPERLAVIFSFIIWPFVLLVLVVCLVAIFLEVVV